MPRLALGENSFCSTGTVLLMKPMPTPETMRATMMCATVYAVACSNAPTIMTMTPN